MPSIWFPLFSFQKQVFANNLPGTVSAKFSLVKCVPYHKRNAKQFCLQAPVTDH